MVDAEGQYVGGAIAPGLELSLEALGRRGAQLRKVELLRPRSVIAKNTVEALQSGMVFGVASQVEGLVARMIAELGVGPSTSRDLHRHLARFSPTSAPASPSTPRGSPCRACAWCSTATPEAETGARFAGTYHQSVRT